MKYNERGFMEFAKFRDERGVEAKVVRSSIATSRRVWVFVDENGSTYDRVRGETGKAALHLDARRARSLAKALMAFADGRG